jgi:DtxR family Mn-dependent transcriptional regulator
MEKNTGLSESLEDYLEAILFLEKKNKVARAKDIAEKLSVRRGSVTGVLKSLEEKKLINYEPYSFITLTAKGKRIAEDVSRRHMVLKDFLLNVLKTDPDAAENAACRMEHAIDKPIMDRLICFIDYIHKCPRAGDDWIKAFVSFCAESDRDNCEQCIESCKVKYQIGSKK